MKIELTGEKQSDKIKLAYSQIRIREILGSGDTLGGIHFVFAGNSTYENFVTALDILRVEKAKTYMPWKNNLWFYNLPIIKKDTTNQIPLISCGTTYTRIIHKPLWWAEMKSKVSMVWNSSWHILAGFIVLVLFQLRFLIIRRN